MSTQIYWFRNDLRLHDNPAFSQAAASASALLPVYCLGSASASHNGDARWGAMQSSVHRQRVLGDSLLDLHAQLQSLGSGLTVFAQAPADILPRLAHTLGVQTIHCESIAATHEQAEIAALVNAGIDVVQTWQSSLFQPHQLPFALPELPAVFTVFRQTLEHHRCRPDAPSPVVAALPSLPSQAHGYGTVDLTRHAQQLPQGVADARSSLPYWQAGFAGGERAGLAHLRRYFASDLPQHYKATRNGLYGVDFSSKLSGWLASGALSPRRVAAEIARYEDRVGPNEGTPWLLKSCCGVTTFGYCICSMVPSCFATGVWLAGRRLCITVTPPSPAGVWVAQANRWSTRRCTNCWPPVTCPTACARWWQAT